MELESIVDSGR